MPLTDTHISLAHGNGGRWMRELIHELIASCLGDLLLDVDNDAAIIPLNSDHHDVLMSSDGFTVKPLEFPGGDIGSLAIHGTTNDLAVSGAVPQYLSLNLVLEEGLEIACLQRILSSLAAAANDTQIKIACGDTKVVPRGEGSGVYIVTTGIGLKPAALSLGMNNIGPGDRILVSGPVGDHGIAVMLAREQFGLRGDVLSDAGSVLALTRCACEFSGLRFMRDPTRGGLATVLHEIQHGSAFGIEVEQDHIPVRDAVQSVCDMLGYDPYYLACEGRVVAVVAADQADQLLSAWQQLPNAQHAAEIGTIVRNSDSVILKTELGGERVLEQLEDDPLPRIC